MIFTGFAWQLPRPIQEWRRVKGSFWWQTKGSIIYRKWVSPHQEGRGCNWHVNKTWWASCMGSWHPQSLGHVFHLFKLKEQRPCLQSGNCFHLRLHLSVCVTECKYGACLNVHIYEWRVCTIWAETDTWYLVLLSKMIFFYWTFLSLYLQSVWYSVVVLLQCLNTVIFPCKQYAIHMVFILWFQLF